MSLTYDSDYSKRINDLKSQVSRYAPKHAFSSSAPVKKSFSDRIPASVKNNISFIVLPILCFVVIWYINPSFVGTTHIDQYNNITYKRSIQKVFVVSMVLSILIYIGIYCYKYKKK